MCPNINIEQVRDEFNEIVTALGGNPLTIEEFKDKELRHLRTGVDAAAMDAAYDIWDLNLGNPIDKAPNGQESILFKSLEEHYGDRRKAIIAKANVYSKAFKNWFGDWTTGSQQEIQVPYNIPNLLKGVVSNFLSEFGISINQLDDYQNDTPLFDALHRIINVKSVNDITDGVGYAIAFMMQGDPRIKKIIDETNPRKVLEGLTKMLVRPFVSERQTKNVLEAITPKQYIIQEIGKTIAARLRDNYGVEVENFEKKDDIWHIISQFFNKLLHKMRNVVIGDTSVAQDMFVHDVVDALAEREYSRIKGPRVKPGTNEIAEMVDIPKALRENDFEREIILKLGERGIALAGGAALALLGSVYRPNENPLHDIDFNAPSFSTKESVEQTLYEIFPKDLLKYISNIAERNPFKKGFAKPRVVTYLYINKPFTLKNESKFNAEIWSADGKTLLGYKKHYDLEFVDNTTKGKLLDIFVYPNSQTEFSFYTKNVDGYNYYISSSDFAMNAKIEWRRPKDMFDYMYYKPDGSNKTVSANSNVSKVVDENGEPLVVYHHTDDPNLNEFSTEFDNYFAKSGGTKNAIFFDQNTTGTLNRAYDIPVFLNIRQLSTYEGTKEDLHKRGTTYREVVNNSALENPTTGGLHMAKFDDNRLENQDVWIIHNEKQVKHIENDGILRDSDANIHHLPEEQDPTKMKRREAFTIEEVAFSNALATNLKALFPELSVDYVEAIDGNYVGEVDLKALRVLIHSTKSTMDTLPHEYAHYYIAMFRGSDLVNEGIAEFGSEEALVLAIGEQTVAQKGKARNLWKRFTDWVKNKLNKNKYGQQVLLALLTDAFLTRKTLGQILAELDGVEHLTANPSITEVKDRLSSISALVEFNEPSHGFTDRQTGKSLRAVSDWKKLYGYETYDDTNEDSLQHRVSDEARQYGDYIHAAMQALFEQRFDPAAFSNMSEETVNSLTWIVNRIKEDYDFVAAEAILADPEKNVAGITDLILKDKHTGEYVLMDYKTKLINYNGSNKNIRGKNLWGFKYVDSTRFSSRTSRHSYDFQLSMYLQILKKYGINISKRFIVPISYKRQDDQITGCFVGHKFGDKTLPDKAAYAEIVPNPAVRFDVVTKIFGDVSNTKLSKEFLQQLVENFVEISSKFRKLLEASVKLFERSNKTKSLARDIRETLSHLADALEVDFFMAYLTLVQNQLAKFVAQLNKRYEDYDNALWDLDVLQRYKEVSSAYEDMDSIIAFMYQFQNAFTEEQIALVEGACNLVMSLKNQIDGAYKQKGAEIYINQIMKYVGNVRQQFEDEARKTFIENNPDATEQQIKQHVEQKVSDNKEKIEFKTKEWIRRQMSVADSVFECSLLSAYLNSVYASRDPLVLATVAMFEEKMQPVDRAYNRYVQQASALLKEYVTKYGGGTFANQRDLYDDMIEVHDGLCYLVQEIPLSYTLAKQAFEKQLREDTSLNRQKREAKLFEWLEINAPVHDLGAYLTELTNRVEEIVLGLSAEEKKAVYDNLKKPMKDRSTWYYLYKTNKISSETEAALRELFIDLEKFRKPSPIYKNDKYQKLLALKSSNDVKWRMYEFLSETAKDADSKVDLYKKRLDGRLPAVRKTSLDRTLEGLGAKSVATNWAKENSCLVEDDAFQGEYIDVNGRKIKQIPLYYNSKKLTEQDQRFDLPTIYGMWYKSALEYDAKRQVRAFMEYTEFVLSTRMTKTNTISWLDKVRGNNQGQEVLAKVDNTARLFSGFMDLVFYNNTLQDLGLTGIVNNSKVFQKILSYYSSLVMSFNGVSGINNFLNAETQGLEEAFGGELFGIKNYMKATKEYWKHMKGMLTDLSSGRAPKDKVSLLVKHFGLFDRNTISLRASGMMRHSLSDIAHWPNTIGEHHSQVRLLLAALMQREALDENGKSLGSLYDYLSFDADGNLIVADGVANFSEADQIEFATAIRTTIMETAGNYDSRMKALANQLAWGRLVLTLRKWVYPSIHRRFAEEYYDNLRGQKVKGFYRSGFKTIRDVAIAPILQYVGLADKLKLKATKWNELSELDKRNFKRFATEMSVLALSSAVFYMLSGISGDGDDEWDVFLKNVQYQAYRLSNDLSFYFNPESFARILQDPFPTMTLLTDITRLFWLLFDPLEEYTSGARKGESKLWYYSSRLLPGIKQMDRFGNIAEEMELFQNVF